MSLHSLCGLVDKLDAPFSKKDGAAELAKRLKPILGQLCYLISISEAAAEATREDWHDGTVEGLWEASGGRAAAVEEAEAEEAPSSAGAAAETNKVKKRRNRRRGGERPPASETIDTHPAWLGGLKAATDARRSAGSLPPKADARAQQGLSRSLREIMAGTHGSLHTVDDF